MSRTFPHEDSRSLELSEEEEDEEPQLAEDEEQNEEDEEEDGGKSQLILLSALKSLSANLTRWFMNLVSFAL